MPESREERAVRLHRKEVALAAAVKRDPSMLIGHAALLSLQIDDLEQKVAELAERIASLEP